MCEKGTHVNPSKVAVKLLCAKILLLIILTFTVVEHCMITASQSMIITCNPIGSGIFGVHIGVDEFAASMIHYDFSALIAHDYNFSLVFRWPFLKILCLAIVQTCC